MGLFSRNFDRPGPGIPKDAPRKKGFARFFEVLGRDFGNLFKANLICAVAFAPGLFFVTFGVLAYSMPVTLLAGLLGGMLAGPFYAGLHDTTLRALRDEPGYWWHVYKRALARNWKASLAPGALLGLLVSSQVFALGFVLMGGAKLSILSAALLGLNMLLTSMAMPFLFGQLVMLDLGFGQLLKNSLLLALSNAPKALLMGIIQVVFWGAMILFMPLSNLVGILFAFAFMVLVTQMIAYPVMDKVFDLESKFNELREKQMED